MPKATIIISVDNSFSLINNFFHLLLSFINKEDYEIIVVDDYCIDYETKQYLADLTKQNSIDILLTLEKKHGFGKANNLGVEKSTTDCLIFMNTDIIINDHILDQLVEIYYMKKYAAMQPLLLYPQTCQIQSAGHIFASYFNRHALENNDADVLKDKTPIRRQALTLAFCVIDKNTFIEAGRFHEFYYNGYEGIELVLKISQLHTCVVIPNLKAYHIRSVAVKNTNFDEEQKIPFFWCRCGALIQHDFPEFIHQYIPEHAFQNKYLAIQFTTLDLLSEVKNAGICVRDDILLIQDSNSTIELFSLLPFSYLKTSTTLLFLCDNFKQLKNNSLWIQLRDNKKDIIIDANGNVKSLHSL